MVRFLIVCECLNFNIKTLINEIKKRDHDYTILRPSNIIKLKRKIKNYDVVINTSENIQITNYIDENIRIFNHPISIKNCNDKWLTYKHLAKYSIVQPYTTLHRRNFDYPFVLKTRRGSFGDGVFLINDDNDLKKIRHLVDSSYLYQEFIETSNGKGLKAIVVGGKVVACVYKESDSFIANMHQGCDANIYELDHVGKEICRKVSIALGIDYCGIDLLFGKDGLVVCEVNANAYVENIMKFTHINPIEKYVNYIVKEIEK